MKTCALVLLAGMSVGGCVQEGEGNEDVLVSAAASLTDAFEAIEQAFEAVNPGLDVVLNLAGSPQLREQILAGAPADVFASASATIMDEVVDAAEAANATVFALNRLQIAVPAGNPAGVRGLDDFSDEDLLLGLCAEGVPCGDFARETLDRAGVQPSIDTEEPNVRALLIKIESGDLDAGITYTTDVIASVGGVEGIDIPDDVNAVAEYPIASLTNSPNPRGADAFVAFVLSSEGAEILDAHGFDTP